MTDELTTQERLQVDLGELLDASQPGDKLPSEPILAQDMGVSRASLRETLRIFENQGMIKRIQGSGTYVNSVNPVLDSGFEVLESIPAMAQRTGIPVGLGDWDISARKPSRQEQLSLNIRDEVLEVSRVILVNKEPAAYLIDIVSTDILSPTDFTSSFTGSVIDLVSEKNGQKLSSARTEIEALEAPENIAISLKLKPGTAVLFFDSEVFNREGAPVIISRSYLLSRCFNFHIVRKIK